MGYWEYHHTAPAGCCGPGCFVMMLTLPFQLLGCAIRKRKEDIKQESPIRKEREQKNS